MKKTMSAVSLMLLFAFGCAVREIDLGEADNGKTVRLGRSQSITILLQSNMTTGYRWSLVTAPDIKALELVSSDYLTLKRALVGSGGVEVWKFRATGPGTTALKLAYFRPFEPNVKPAKEFLLTLEVK